MYGGHGPVWRSSEFIDAKKDMTPVKTIIMPKNIVKSIVPSFRIFIVILPCGITGELKFGSQEMSQPPFYA